MECLTEFNFVESRYKGPTSKNWMRIHGSSLKVLKLDSRVYLRFSWKTNLNVNYGSISRNVRRWDFYLDLSLDDISSKLKHLSDELFDISDDAPLRSCTIPRKPPYFKSVNKKQLEQPYGDISIFSNDEKWSIGKLYADYEELPNVPHALHLGTHFKTDDVAIGFAVKNSIGIYLQKGMLPNVCDVIDDLVKKTDEIKERYKSEIELTSVR